MMQMPQPPLVQSITMQPLMQQQYAAVGSGCQRLAPFADLFVKQQVQLLEVMTGFEEANKYDIFVRKAPQIPMGAHWLVLIALSHAGLVGAGAWPAAAPVSVPRGRGIRLLFPAVRSV